MVLNESNHSMHWVLPSVFSELEKHEDPNGRVKTTNKRILVLLVLFVVHDVCGLGTLATICPKRDNVPRT